ncbi:RES family NAD+ phosphorylase [uncultured Lamprocystis sp.]|jgi:hypothetical protein|uniref:RES family NAD+ phosphorylase n=1 Tax=uncultured Lamprocystis sp. TaxID=543132 RepID=UPI0025F78808|nr:RES family NAD+ phosphorylase [uncultured Lamprocystis sp.]
MTAPNRSTIWREFCSFIEWENRFILTSEMQGFVDWLKETSSKYALDLDANSNTFYRCRSEHYLWKNYPVGSGETADVYGPLPCKEMGPPPREKAKGQRVNPEGMAYLYVALSEKTAIAEMRPWLGAELTIGIFSNIEPIRVIDVSRCEPQPEFVHLFDSGAEDPAVMETRIWGSINRAFSTPKEPDGMGVRYLATQYLAEVFKAAGYDALGYMSALDREGGNLAVFCPHKLQCHDTYSVVVDQVEYRSRRQGWP